MGALQTEMGENSARHAPLQPRNDPERFCKEAERLNNASLGSGYAAL
jgi:hypothetical protein